MLFDPGPSDKKCFMYCGDDRCDCEASPRYRNWPQLPDDFITSNETDDAEKTG